MPFFQPSNILSLLFLGDLVKQSGNPNLLNLKDSLSAVSNKYSSTGDNTYTTPRTTDNTDPTQMAQILGGLHTFKKEWKKDEMELVNFYTFQEQIEAGKPYAEFIRELGIRSIEAQLALKMKIAAVLIKKGMSCEDIIRKFGIFGMYSDEARVKLEMMAVNLPSTRAQLEAEGSCYRIRDKLGLHTDQAKLALEMIAINLPDTLAQIEAGVPCEKISSALNLRTDQAKLALDMKAVNRESVKKRIEKGASCRNLISELGLHTDQAKLALDMMAVNRESVKKRIEEGAVFDNIIRRLNLPYQAKLALDCNGLLFPDTSKDRE